MFDIFYFGKKPNVAPFELHASCLEEAASKSRTEFFWYIYGNNDYTGFNFYIRPVPWEETHVYTYGSQWQKDAGVYLAHKEHAHKKIWNFKSDQRVTRLPDIANWYIPDYVDVITVDTSWHPDPHDASYTYHFPSKHQSSSGVTYNSGHTEIKFSHALVIETLPRLENWTVPEDIDPETVDYTWHPNPLDPDYVYHFSDDYQEFSGLMYTVPGATEIKMSEGFGTKTRVPDIFFIDKNNQQSAQRFATLKERYPTAQKLRYANSMLETVKRCIARTSTNKFWVISSENIYDDFDFAWHANSWQGFMTHVFGSKWQKWSDTYLVDKWVFERNAKWAKSIAEFPDLNFVTNQYVVIPEDLYDVYYIDHNNAQQNKGVLLNRFPKFKTTRFVDNYLDTLKRIVATATTEYIWVTSSLCDYAKFDFSWQPEPWQADMLHVFASKNQKFGDTFYIPVAKFKQQMDQLELLDWFDTVNYCDEQVVPYIGIDIVRYNSDDLVRLVKEHKFTAPYAVFTTTGEIPDFTPSVWRKKDRAVHTFTRSGSISVVPRDIQAELSSQLYDYPYINKHKDAFLVEKPLDIVFISNGEPDAERWYEHTCRVADREVKRVQNVNGRVQAYQAAANSSDTEWFFTVFAKLEMVEDFDWEWQPDRLQEPKHYIFNARNPVNGLEYGHQGMIVYNKRLVLETEQSGLDFTLSKAHEVVPVLSGIAHFNQDPWTTWRTAFREVVKLKYFMDTAPTMETEHRLNTWLKTAQGDNAEYCLSGALDAIDYYHEVEGDYDRLFNTFEWDWLRERFTSLHKSQ